MSKPSSTLTPATEFVFGERPEDIHSRVHSDTYFEMPSLWTVDVTTQWEGAARIASDVLDERELRRAAEFVRSGNRRCYVVAHVALRVLLGARLGIAPGAVRLVREPCPSCGESHGRPAVGGAGSVGGSGGGTHFSLSHSGDLALIGMAGSPVGVDVEQLPRLDVAMESSALLHPAETAEVAAQPDRAKPLAFARAWVRKESYLKGIGTGLSRDPSLDYVGTGLPPGPGPAGWILGDVPVPAGYAAAFAVRACREDG